jgi:phage-related protein
MEDVEGMSKKRSKQTAETQLSSDRIVSSQTLEELKQRYFQRYKYDPRLAELFDLIPAHKLRKYLTEKIEETPSVYLKSFCKFMTPFK